MRSSLSRTTGARPRRFKAAAVDSPAAPPPTTTMFSVGGVIAPENEDVRREHEVEDDRNRSSEPALAWPPRHPDDVAKPHDRRVDVAECEERLAEPRPRFDRLALSKREGDIEPRHQTEDRDLSG